jgi:hypothetical protein
VENDGDGGHGGASVGTGPFGEAKMLQMRRLFNAPAIAPAQARSGAAAMMIARR